MSGRAATDFLIEKLKQPYMIAYILVGILFGPYVGGIFNNTDDIASLGELGLLLLMFFLGMEMDIPDRQSLLLKPVIAQGMKMLLSITFATVLGFMFGWSVYSITVLAVLFIFNSTAVVSEYLIKNGELHTGLGKTLLNILLLQDLFLAPVLTVFQFMGKQQFSPGRMVAALIACAVIALLLRAIKHRDIIKPEFLKELDNDHELQVFLGGFVSLGFGLIAELAGLSGAMGSFAAGMLIGRTKSFQWLEHSLKPFRIFFVSFFFMSIGLRLDLGYLALNYKVVLSGTLIVLLCNSLLTAIVFRTLQYNWRQSFYSGALLSQTGEFGILICTMAYKMHIIDSGFFKTGVAITALTLLLSTTWITVLKKVVGTSAN
ncbi:cation:proton antiporter [Sphingobacterium sp. KU25419]|nr:cation:proton antiporter [Sphingobacterium sp. KU25419]